MNYQVSRNGQIYGPYTLDDIRRYLASGNILLNDLAKSDEMTEWLPVSQILANSTAVPPVTPLPVYPDPAPGPAYENVPNASAAPSGAPYTPISAQATATIAMAAYPDPPALHWALVLLFSCLTCGLFMIVWNLIIATWLRRVQPNANALYFYIAHAVLVSLIFLSPGNSHHAFMPGVHFRGTGFFGGALLLVNWVAKLIARFSAQASLEEHFNGPEPIGLVLNPVMTFFFGGLYFQYHLTRIHSIKQAARFGRAAAPYAY